MPLGHSLAKAYFILDKINLKIKKIKKKCFLIKKKLVYYDNIEI